MNDTTAAEKVVFPILGSNVWWTLRKKVRQTVPKTIDRTYLATVLDIGEKAAQNIIPQLRRFGLISENGAPTELLFDWRDDDKYAEVCQTIIEKIYPEPLRDAVGTEKPDPDRVAKWITRVARTGEGTARQSAGLYVLLCEKDPNGPNVDSQRKRPTTTSGGSQRAPRSSSAKSGSAAVDPVPPPAYVAPPNVSVPSGPTLHVDVQIHISPDASAEQIDTIFASMARHFSNRPN